MINPFQDLIQAPRLLCPAGKKGASHPAKYSRQASPLMTRCVATYVPGGSAGTTIGDGCYRTLPRHGQGRN